MVIHSLSTTVSSSIGTTAPEGLLISHIQAHIKKGELAEARADQNRKHAEGHYVAAGRYLTMLKVTYAPTWSHWETLLKVKVKLSTGRASELMQLADGRKDLQQIRDGKAQSVARLRASKSLHYSSEEKTDDDDEPLKEGPQSAEGRKLKTGNAVLSCDPNSLIDVLAGSTPAVRSAAVELVVQGSRQSQFEAITNAVVDLYQRLARAGQ
jgi:hypothetical protein